MRKLLLATAVTLACSATTVGAVPFQNGSLESPGGATVVFLPNGSTYVTGWVHGGNTNGEFYSKSGDWGINAGDGSYYLGWGANGATGGTLSQTFDTLIGTTYNINYLLTTQQLGPPIPIEVAFVEALDGSNVLASVTNSFNQPAGVWNSGATLSFVATSTSTTLRFIDQTTTNNSGPVNWGLDAITVGAVGPGPNVPEPATLALLGLGLAGLGFSRRRKQKAA